MVRRSRRRVGGGPSIRHTATRYEADVTIEGLFVLIGHRQSRRPSANRLEVDERRYLVIYDDTLLEDRRRVHRRRRPRSPLSAAGRDHGRRRLQGRHRCRALARVAGHRRGRHLDFLVADVLEETPIRHGQTALNRADDRGAPQGYARPGGRCRHDPLDLGNVTVLDAGCGRPRRSSSSRTGSTAVGVDIHAPATPLPYLDESATATCAADGTSFPEGSFDSCSRTSRSSISPIPGGPGEPVSLAAAGRNARDHDREPAASVRERVPVFS